MRARLVSSLERAAGEFITRESNQRSLITVTRVEVDERETRARIFVSVLPQEQTAAAIDFLSRQKDKFRKFLKTKIQARVLPQVLFLPDPAMGLIEETTKT